MNEIADITKALDTANSMLQKSERLMNATRIIIGGVVLAVLWISRVEYTQADHSARISAQGIKLDAAANDVARIKGRLDIASVLPPAAPETPQVVWTTEERENCPDKETNEQETH